MLLIRRLWLLPAALLTALVYFLFIRSHDSTSTKPFQYPANSEDGLLHWKKRPEQYPIKGAYTLPPRGRANSLPNIQAKFADSPETPEAKKTREERREKVKEAFVHSWEGYKKYAWTKDEVAPVSGKWMSSFGGWGATLVDTMDTLWIMDMKTDFEQCVEAVRDIDFTTNTEEILNVFETTIRYLGGLLAAYDLSDRRYRILLTKAQELGEILYTAFDTRNRMPVTRWQWRKTALGAIQDASEATLLAEFGSLSLEFTRLTQLTGEVKYYDAIHRITNELERMQNTTRMPGLWPTLVNARDLTADYNHFTLAGMADSTYEYLPKQHILVGARSMQNQHMYINAIEVAMKNLFFRPMTPNGDDILFSGNAAMGDDNKVILEPQGQHLSCFVGGMVGMASRIFWRPDDLVIARKLVDGCIWAYNSLPSGLMPETFHLMPCHVGVGEADPEECKWNADRYYTAIAERHGSDDESASMNLVQRGKYWVTKKKILPGFTAHGDNRYILRPEAIESIFILYRITGDPQLLEDAWSMFKFIDSATRTEFAHAALKDVRNFPPEKEDRMESFWLAETLKYFYLIFSEPGLVSLDEYVLNTEAHPFKRPTMPPTY